jgi:hypothetical protein
VTDQLHLEPDLCLFLWVCYFQVVSNVVKLIETFGDQRELD